MSTQGSRRLAWAAFAVLLVAAAVWLMYIGRGTYFGGDDIFYYAEWVIHGASIERGHGFEYFLAPHNGHLQTVGKLVYRLLFEIVGTDYVVFRAVDVFGMLVATTLFYVLVSRRLGPVAALVPTILIPFLGYAWELSVWAFDMHTVYALAFGLGALLALERGDRLGDGLACALLVLATGTIELGLAFVVGATVFVLLRPERWRRIWVVAVPLVLYVAWYLWSRKFHQSTIDLHNVRLIPADLTEALAAVAGSIFGLNPTGSEIAPEVTTVTAAGTVLAVLAVLGLVARVRRGSVPPTLWAFLAVALTYWTMIALGGRAPDASRYILAGAAMVFLVAADALKGARLSPLAVAGGFVVVALVLPPNIAKFYDGRRTQLAGSQAGRTEFAMVDLARHVVSPSYAAPEDEEVIKVGGGYGPALAAREYFRAAARFGSLGYSLEQIRDGSLTVREVADATLVGAMNLHLEPSRPPRDRSQCSLAAKADPQHPEFFWVLGGGVAIGSRSSAPVEAKLSRFALEWEGRGIGQIAPGTWATLKPPPDAAPERWRLGLWGPAIVCQVG